MCWSPYRYLFLFLNAYMRGCTYSNHSPLAHSQLLSVYRGERFFQNVLNIRFFRPFFFFLSLPDTPSNSEISVLEWVYFFGLACSRGKKAQKMHWRTSKNNVSDFYCLAAFQNASLAGSEFGKKCARLLFSSPLFLLTCQESVDKRGSNNNSYFLEEWLLILNQIKKEG